MRKPLRGQRSGKGTGSVNKTRPRAIPIPGARWPGHFAAIGTPAARHHDAARARGKHRRPSSGIERATRIPGARHQESSATTRTSVRAISSRSIPGTPSGAPSPRQGMGSDRECAGSPALPAPLDRNHSSSSLSASPEPDPLFEVEHLALGAEPEPQQELWREQRDVLAGGAIDLDKVALAKILDPRGAEGKHSRASMFLVRSRKARGRGRVNG